MIRRHIESQVLSLTGLAIGGVDYENPPGDPGLFGPDSVCWRVHGDFTSMLIGGISALLLQALHPLALAGVWDHSNFRDDLLGRLRRTVREGVAPTWLLLATRQIAARPGLAMVQVSTLAMGLLALFLLTLLREKKLSILRLRKDRKSTRLNSSHMSESRMPSSA